MSTVLGAYNPTSAGWSPFIDPITTAPTTNVALLATSDEVAMWQDRAANGPFRSTGDFSNNSPGHWLEMDAARSTSWVRWSGPQYLSGGKVVLLAGSNGLANDPPGSVRINAHDMMSAAYAALVLDDTALASQIRTEIEWHANATNLDFSNRTLYPYAADGRDPYYSDLNPLFIICIWAIDLAQAYDIVKAMGYESAVIEGWFDALADLAEYNLHGRLGFLFPNRKSDSYTSRAALVDNNILATTRLGDGSLVYHLEVSQNYNNRRHAMAGLTGLAGMLSSTQAYVDEAKRYAREWMMFGHRTTTNQETFGDHDRGSNVFPQLGFSYDLGGLGHLLPALESVARSGDTSVYDFSSSEGSAHPTWGSDHLKTFQEVLNQRQGWIRGTITGQYTASGVPPSSSVSGDEFYRIKSRASENNNELGADAHLLMPAAYYGRTDWVDAVMRVGTPTGFTATPKGMGPIWGWRVDWRQRFLRSLDANPYGGG